MAASKAPKILTGVGCLAFGLSFGVLTVSLLLPPLTSGRTSWEEAMLGIVPGVLCSGLSFLLLVGGLVWLMKSRRSSS